ncbi:MAG TPA: phosphatase PAP2 family protein [Burkholderiales bacterium]|nr:phosphatase PAP2 family protein [Burkholderiales bacterium]
MSASPLPEMDAPQMPSTALPPASLAARPTQWSIAVLACAVARRRDALMHLAPLLPLALLLVALDRTSLDSTVSAWFFDRATDAFPLRYSSALEVFAHHYAKELVIALEGCVIALFLLSYVLPDLSAARRRLGFLALALALAPLAVALLKLGSYRHCPWDLAEFGGFAPHLGLLDPVPARVPAGHCFPAGHPSTGFCLMAFYFALRGTPAHRWARPALAAGIAAGLLLGLGRIAQGAHFLSHVLWSGVVCWLVIVVVQQMILRGD